MTKTKPRCIEPGHGDLHPVYYRGPDGKMVRAGAWHYCTACPADDMPFWDNQTNESITVHNKEVQQ